MGIIRLPADEIVNYAERYDADYDAPIAKLVPEVRARQNPSLFQREKGRDESWLGSVTCFQRSSVRVVRGF